MLGIEPGKRILRWVLVFALVLSLPPANLETSRTIEPLPLLHRSAPLASLRAKEGAQRRGLLAAVPFRQLGGEVTKIRVLYLSLLLCLCICVCVYAYRSLKQFGGFRK